MAEALPDMFAIGADVSDITAKLEGLQRELGETGTAAQRAGTTASAGLGTMGRAASQTSSALEAMRPQVGALAAGFSGMGGLLSRLTPQLGQWPAILGQTITTTIGLTSAMGPMGAALGIATGAVTLLSQALDMQAESAENASRKVRVLQSALLDWRALAAGIEAHTASAQAQQAQESRVLSGRGTPAEREALMLGLRERGTSLLARIRAAGGAAVAPRAGGEAHTGETAAIAALRRDLFAVETQLTQLEMVGAIGPERERQERRAGGGRGRSPEERVRSLVELDSRVRFGGGEAVDLDAYAERLKLEQQIVDAKRDELELTGKLADGQRDVAKAQQEASAEAREAVALAAEATTGIAEALLEGDAGALAAWLESFAKKEGLRALEEVALGVGTALVPGLQAESAGHFNAATLHGAAAAAAGGAALATGGGGRGAAPATGGDGGGIAGGASGERVTYVINYNAPVDEASVGRMQARAQRAAARRFGR